MRTLHTGARPVSRQGTIVFDPRVPATPRVPLRCVRYYDAKIRFRSTKTLCRAGSGVAHSGGLCTLGIIHSTSTLVREIETIIQTSASPRFVCGFIFHVQAYCWVVLLCTLYYCVGHGARYLVVRRSGPLYRARYLVISTERVSKEKRTYKLLLMANSPPR